MAYRPTVYKNILDSIQALIAAVSNFELKYSKPENEVGLEIVFTYAEDGY